MELLSIEQLADVLDVEKYRESRIDYVERMKEDGFHIFYPSEYELALDFDTKEQLEYFYQIFERFCSEHSSGNFSFKEYSSKTKGHCHVIVTLPFRIKSDIERVAYQLILGSDPVREMLSIFRIWNEDPYPSLLAMKEAL